jgi:hypothetical protein
MNKITLPLSCLSLFISSQVLAVEHNLDNAGEVDKFVTADVFHQKTLTKKQSAVKLNAESVVESTITPICPTLATGSLYTLSNSQPGESICYHFEITERSKTTALLVGQSTETDVNLSVLRHNPDDTFTAIGTSANTGNLDEVVLTLTEPGHYYWFMEVIDSDGSPFNFGAAIATDLDAYEFNDTVATSTLLSDKQHTITGNMDSASDLDYFQFTAVRGQDVILKFEDAQLDEWIIELYNNGWVEVAKNTDLTISNLQPNQNINIRVRANPNLPINSSNDYKLTIGTKVTSVSNYSVSGEPNVNRVTYSGFGSSLYATTQAYHKLTWSVTLQDSTGYPVEGAKAKLRVDQDVSDGSINYIDFEKTSNSLGRISGSVNLGDCHSDITFRHTEYSLGYKNIWETDLIYGVWRLEIPNTGNLDLGIGGDNVEYVVLGHLCDQKLLSTSPS